MRKLNIDLKPELKELEIFTKRAVSIGGIRGKYKSYFKGKGLEFEDYRAYSPQDDARRIDWKATVRSGEVLIKEFMEERNIRVMFMIDVGDSMVFGSTQKLKCEYAAEVTATLYSASLKTDDAVGHFLYSDKIVDKKECRRGNREFFIFSDVISDPDNYGGKTDINMAIKFLVGFLPRDSLVIIISDFLNLKGNWKENLTFASAKYELIGVCIRDPLDYRLPIDAGQVVVSDIYSGKEVLISPKKVTKKYEQVAKQQLEDVKQHFVGIGGDFLELTTDKPFAEKVRKFFASREARMRYG